MNIQQLQANNAQAHALGLFIKEICKEAYKEARREILEEQERQEPKMYTRQELAKRLGVSLPTLHNLINQGIITPIHIGAKPLFSARDIEAAINGGSLAKYHGRGELV